MFEELIVESATYSRVSGGTRHERRLDPYVAGWGEQGALEAIQQVAELIDRVAERIEEAIRREVRSGEAA